MKPTQSVSPTFPAVTSHYSLVTVVVLAFACLELPFSQSAFGVSPAPDGDYVGGSTAEGGAFISGIRGMTTGNADSVPVLIDSNGQLDTMSSSGRFKKDIKSMDQASEAILALNPVTFHYKGDTKDTPQFGLIAEEVAKVNADLVVRDAQGEIYSVRHEAVNAMLLNEFLKEHRTVEELRSTLAKQEESIAALNAKLQQQAVQLQKVGAELTLWKSALQTAVNDR